MVLQEVVFHMGLSTFLLLSRWTTYQHYCFGWSVLVENTLVHHICSVCWWQGWLGHAKLNSQKCNSYVNVGCTWLLVANYPHKSWQSLVFGCMHHCPLRAKSEHIQTKLGYIQLSELLHFMMESASSCVLKKRGWRFFQSYQHVPYLFPKHVSPFLPNMLG